MTQKRTRLGITTTRGVSSRPPGLEPADRVRAEAQRLATIVTKADADAAGLFVQEARRRVKAIKAHYKRVSLDPLKEAYDDARAKVLAMLNEDAAPLEEADRLLSPVLEAWMKAETARVQAEARRLLEEAQAAAAAERQAQVATLQRAAEEAETPAERRLLRQLARDVEAAPLLPSVSALAARPEAVTVAGVSLRTDPATVAVQSLPALVAAVAAGTVAIDALQPNQKWLDALATQQGETFSVPGCVRVVDSSLAAKPAGRR